MSAGGTMQQGLTQNAVYPSVLASINKTIFTHYSNPCSSDYQSSTRTSYGWGFATRWRARINPASQTSQTKHPIRGGGWVSQGGTPGRTAQRGRLLAEHSLFLMEGDIKEGCGGEGQGSLSRFMESSQNVPSYCLQTKHGLCIFTASYQFCWKN